MSNANVGKVFNMTGGSGGGGTLRLETLTITKPKDHLQVRRVL